MQTYPQKREPAINQTGFRVLTILKLLMEDAKTKDELLRSVNACPYVNEISKDTIKLDISTLKSLGFEIKTIESSGLKKYQLKFSPLKINLTKSQVGAINQIKRAVISLWEWRYIIALYRTLDKISKFVKDKELADEILDFQYFLRIDFELLKELDCLAQKKSEVTLKYNSPKAVLCR